VLRGPPGHSASTEAIARVTEQHLETTSPSQTRGRGESIGKTRFKALARMTCALRAIALHGSTSPGLFQQRTNFKFTDGLPTRKYVHTLHKFCIGPTVSFWSHSNGVKFGYPCRSMVMFDHPGPHPSLDDSRLQFYNLLRPMTIQSRTLIGAGP
jgi:hypothetical protein